MYAFKNNYTNTEKSRTWKVAIYVRLSIEDEKDERYKGQSESIENQIKFLKPIVEKMGWNLFDVYKDDGYTGTNFNRPDFKRMINDIERGVVNLVITKDLSRLGRDYIETGRLLEKYFPEKRVRYIAVNDNVDSDDNNNTNNDITPFKTVFNDMYAKDISKKVRTSIETKAMAGECIKPFLPYGFKKDANNKNNILIDDEVADNVRKIFHLYMKGYTKTKIASLLNQSNVKTPLQYKKEKTRYFNPNERRTTTYAWNSTTVNKILKDRMYVGDLIQLKNKKINYKIKKIEKVPIEEQIVIENHHQAIIDRNTFNIVQDRLNRQTNEWDFSGNTRHLLTGLVFCKCGGRISYNKNHGKYFRCICSSYKRYGNKFCTNVHLREDDLIEIVRLSLKNNISKHVDIKELNFKETKLITYCHKDLIKLKNKKEEINKLISSLYEDKVAEIISQDTFVILIKKYEQQKQEINENVLQYEKNLAIKKENESKDSGELKKIIKDILKLDNITDENKTLLFKLIDKIVIDDNIVNIYYKFDIDI